MTKQLLLIAVLFSIQSLLAQQTFYQYFDGADTSIYNAVMIEKDTNSCWQIGPPQKTLFNSASTVPNVIITDTINSYRTNDTSSFRIRILNEWENWGILALQWSQKLDLDSLNDWGIVEYSKDDGVTWYEVFDDPFVYNFYGWTSSNVAYMPSGFQGFTHVDTTWKNIWLCFDLSWLSVALPDTLDFRFTVISDSMETNQEGWMIDNFIAGFTWVHTLPENPLDGYMQISPNPTEGRIDIRTQKINEFHIIEEMNLINMRGEVVQTWKNVPTKYFIDIDDHPDGIYYLKVRTNIKTEEFKVVLTR
jgi:hypothetical protein